MASRSASTAPLLLSVLAALLTCAAASRSESTELEQQMVVQSRGQGHFGAQQVLQAPQPPVQVHRQKPPTLMYEQLPPLVSPSVMQHFAVRGLAPQMLLSYAPREPQVSLLDEHDKRDNLVANVQTETLWAVSTLSASGKENTVLPPCRLGPTNMDHLWNWIDLMQRNDAYGQAFELDPPITTEAENRNSDPSELVWAIQSDHDFKIGGMDRYEENLEIQGATCKLPNGEIMTAAERDHATRLQSIFVNRGRLDIRNASEHHAAAKSHNLLRKDSVNNTHAGIAALEDLPAVALSFFKKPLIHTGKSVTIRSYEATGTDTLFYRLGAPFIGGASGSIAYMVITMEDQVAGQQPHGLIPSLEEREALIGIMTAALIAGGQHSLAECISVAQAMGYFTDLTPVLESYTKGATEFAGRLRQLGVGSR